MVAACLPDIYTLPWQRSFVPVHTHIPATLNWTCVCAIQCSSRINWADKEMGFLRRDKLSPEVWGGPEWTTTSTCKQIEIMPSQSSTFKRLWNRSFGLITLLNDQRQVYVVLFSLSFPMPNYLIWIVEQLLITTHLFGKDREFKFHMCFNGKGIVVVLSGGKWKGTHAQCTYTNYIGGSTIPRKCTPHTNTISAGIVPYLFFCLQSRLSIRLTFHGSTNSSNWISALIKKETILCTRIR